VNRAWRNGASLPLSQVGFGIDTAAARYGLAVFEGFTAFIHPADDRSSAVILGLDLHLQRFKRSVEAIGLRLDPSGAALREAVFDVLRENQPYETCAVRLFGYSEAERFDYVGPATVAIFLLSLSGYAPPRPLRLTVSPFERSSVGDLPRYVKATSHYVGARRAVLAAKREGFDDVIFLNERGNVTESSRASLLLLTGSRIATAPESDGVLPGITRQILRRLSETRLGTTWEERTLTTADLASADEVALCSSSLGVASVGAIDQHDYRSAPLVPRIAALLAEAEQAKLHLDDITDVLSLEPVH